MKISVYSYAGDTTINDGTNFSASFPLGSVMNQADGAPITVDRVHFSPLWAAKTRTARYLPLEIKCLGTLHSQVDTLKKLFPTFEDTDKGLRTLIIKDAADSNRQWEVYATPISFKRDGTQVTVTLLVPDPIWRVSTQNADVWSITATGQTHDITTLGTWPVEPIFDIKPTVAKSGNLQYRRSVIVYNKLATSLPREPLDITGGGLNTATLVADTTVSNQINQGGGIDNSVTTIPIDTAVGGGLPVSGTGYVGTEQISWTANSGSSLTGVVRGINGTAAASHADNAVISRSKVQADGDDFLVFINGIQTNWWFGTGSNAFNQSATKVWVTQSFSGGINLTLAAAGASDTSLTIQNTIANVTALRNLPVPGAALIESEVVTWTGKDISGLQLTGVTRGARGTTGASHSAGVTLYWVEYDIEFAYGDNTLSAPVMDDTYKPIFALTSTNTVWTYTGASFATSGGKRGGEWVSALLASSAPVATRTSEIYTATQHTFADPATSIGVSIGAYPRGNKWKADNAQLAWTWYSPVGATDVTFNGKVYRVGSAWPGTKGNMSLQKSTDGVHWTNVWNQSSPASASSWTSYTGSPTSLSGTYYYLRLYAKGATSPSTSAEGAIEGTTVAITRPSGSVPGISVGSERSSTYELNCKLTNNGTGEYIKVHKLMTLNQTIRVDCLNHAVSLLDDNSDAYGALTLSTVRADWLNLAPGTTVTLQFDDTGTAGVTLTTRYYDRAL